MQERSWNLQDAKAKLSELVDQARAGKPQMILRRGAPAAVLVSVDEYRAFRPREPLVSFLLNSPLVNSAIDIPRLEETYRPRADLFNEEEP